MKKMKADRIQRECVATTSKGVEDYSKAPLSADQVSQASDGRVDYNGNNENNPTQNQKFSSNPSLFKYEPFTP
jgi:hypothetical protein